MLERWVQGGLFMSTVSTYPYLGAPVGVLKLAFSPLGTELVWTGKVFCLKSHANESMAICMWCAGAESVRRTFIDCWNSLTTLQDGHCLCALGMMNALGLNWF